GDPQPFGPPDPRDLSRPAEGEVEDPHPFGHPNPRDLSGPAEGELEDPHPFGQLNPRDRSAPSEGDGIVALLALGTVLMLPRALVLRTALTLRTRLTLRTVRSLRGSRAEAELARPTNRYRVSSTLPFASILKHSPSDLPRLFASSDSPLIELHDSCRLTS